MDTAKHPTILRIGPQNKKYLTQKCQLCQGWESLLICLGSCDSVSDYQPSPGHGPLWDEPTDTAGSEESALDLVSLFLLHNLAEILLCLSG